MKHLFTAAALLFSMTAFAQVGINNTSPKATLDITAKTTDGSKPEGLIIPQLSGSNIHTATAAGVYGTNQKGLIIYATSADSSPISTTANITSAGYYYFDGSVWQKMSGASAGDTTNDAWINDTTNGLVKLGTKAGGTARAAGTDFVVKDNGQVGIGTSTPSAALDVNSTQGGFVPPRMTTSQRDVLISPPTGSIIFNTITNQLELNTGTSTIPYWEKLLNSIPNSTRVEHSSLNIAPLFDMNLLTNNGPNWIEISQLKKTITVSVGAQIGVTFNCILNEYFLGGGGGALAQADILVTVTPNATGLASTLPLSSYSRDSFALLFANGAGQSTAISVAKSLVATTTQYTVQVYVYRGNSPTNHNNYALSPIYTNILVTN
ncbi:hypothetical protein SAMN05421846_101134 [Chryseobacterium taeanense]|uniref:Uncharacterized protein n=1 Tax=Chryseobacterium taeanense TaxID=311334 RepID=A0A1G8DDT9_9FLAO|nr:hypothetical protein [Chryseobacterium taeanense]SDH55609.1 hypothetical protein SAMN05421846_101134 [Chryseobacterium taeanense]